jgi:hypothetical protein
MRIRRRYFLGSARAAVAAPLLAAPDVIAAAAADNSRKEVTDYLERAARAITDRAAAEIRSREKGEKVRARRREEMRDMLGLLPWPERAPLHPRDYRHAGSGPICHRKDRVRKPAQDLCDGESLPAEGPRPVPRNHLCVWPRALALWGQDAVSAAWNFLRQERLRCVYPRSDPDRGNVRAAPRRVHAGNVRLVFARLYSGGRRNLECHARARLSGKRGPRSTGHASGSPGDPAARR